MLQYQNRQPNIRRTQRQVKNTEFYTFLRKSFTTERIRCIFDEEIIKVLTNKNVTTMLAKGTKAPYFEGQDENGNTVKLTDFAGKKLVLYFYPKDSTPGCTAEACDLRDNYERFLSLGYEIVGVSRDSAASHQRFIAKYSLPFHLIADTDLTILKAYEAWGEKKMYGKVTEGTLRTTYVIDEQGTIIDAIGKVDTKNHTTQIL